MEAAPEVAQLEISPDGRLLVGSTLSGREVVLLDAATGRTQRRLQVSGEAFAYIVASPATAAESPLWRRPIARRLSGTSARVGCSLGCRSERVARPSTSARTGQRSTPQVPTAPCATGTSTGTGASSPRWPRSHRRGVHGDVDRPLAATVAALHSDDQVEFFDVESGTVGPRLDRRRRRPRAAAAGIPTASTTPSRPAARSGSGMRGRPADRSSTTVGTDISGVDYSTDGSRLVMAELSGRVTMLDSTTLDAGRPAGAARPRLSAASPPGRTTTRPSQSRAAGPLGFWRDPSTRLGTGRPRVRQRPRRG